MGGWRVYRRVCTRDKRRRAHLAAPPHHHPTFSGACDLILLPARHAKRDRTTESVRRDTVYLRAHAAVARPDEKASWLKKHQQTPPVLPSDALIRGYGTPWDKELVDQVTHFNHDKKKTL